MANVLIRIKSLIESFPATQRQLADYILLHPEDVPFLSVHELARVTGVSVATVSRFARILGYSNFKNFKTALGMNAQDASTTFSGIFRSILASDNDNTVIEKVFHGNVTSLNDTLAILERNDLIRAARIISRSERLVFCGIGSSGFIAHDAALRFSQLAIQAEAYSDSYQILSQALRIRNRDVVVGISHSGRSMVTVQALEIAQHNGGTALGISNYAKSPLHDASRIFFCTSFPENQVKVAAQSSRIAQMCILDSLYILVARYKNVSFAKAERLNSYVEKSLRLPGK